jgi:hypothetical protein
MTRIRIISSYMSSLLLAASPSVFAQAPDVPIVRDRGEQFNALGQQANASRADGKLLSREVVMKQIGRTTCTLNLPKPLSKRLTDRQIWQRSRESHVRVGWHYLCHKCEKWHQNLAGGYFITADGAVATCFHVVQPDPSDREGYLVAADENGHLLPVTEVLAGNEAADTAIIRVRVEAPVKPLPLNTNLYPGDGAWCYSDPLGRSSYFSKGMVNRFFWQERKKTASPRIEVSTDWAPGSSGAAVLDECGNAIGHVSEISSGVSPRGRGTNRVGAATSPMIVFHCAARAADVISLVRPPKKP